MLDNFNIHGLISGIRLSRMFETSRRHIKFDNSGLLENNNSFFGQN